MSLENIELPLIGRDFETQIVGDLLAVRTLTCLKRAPRRIGLGELQRVPLEEAVDQVGARAASKEQRDDFDMVLLRGLHQRRFVVSVTQIGVCIGVEQRPHDGGMTFIRGDDQGSSVAAALKDCDRWV